MIDRLSAYLKKLRFGVKAVSAIAFVSLLAGLVVASGFNWTAPRAAHATLPTASTTVSPAVQGSFAGLAEQLTPSVVNIKVIKIEKTGLAMNQIPNGPYGDFFQHFFGNMMPQEQQIRAAGSGIIISADGYILTNNHVVEGAKEVSVTLSDKRDLKAKIVGRDPKTDLAVLKISAGDQLPAARLGDSDRLRVGDWVLAIGNPFGLSHTVTSGIVSAKGRVIGEGPYDDFIQTDASINPGNSGGPLFNMSGEVVGINTAIIPNGQGIGFAIPVNTAKEIVPQLEAKGVVTRGYIGVNIQSVTPEIARALKLDGQRGALVADVVSGGPAEAAGVKRGDVIISFNGKSVKDAHDLPALVAASKIGQDATLVVLRNGKENSLTVKVAKLASSESSSGGEGQGQSQEKFGLELQDITPQIAGRLGLKSEQGVVITDVKPGSPADNASLRQGDVILEINRKHVSSVEDAKKDFAKASDKGSVLLLIERNKAKLFVALKG